MKKKIKYNFLGFLIITVLILTNSISASVDDVYRDKIFRDENAVTVIDILSPVEFLVEKDNDQFKVKLLNTYPPKEANIYEEAKNEARRFLLGNKVHIMFDEVKQDKDGKPLVMLYYAQANYLVNASLIERGYAYYEHNYPFWLQYELELLEVKAKRNNDGMWKNYEITQEDINIEKIAKENRKNIEMTMVSFDYLKHRDAETVIPKISETAEDYIKDIPNIEIEYIREEISIDVEEDKAISEEVTFIDKFETEWPALVFSLNLQTLLKDRKNFNEEFISLLDIIDIRFPSDIGICFNDIHLMEGLISKVNENQINPEMLLYLYGDFSNFSVESTKQGIISHFNDQIYLSLDDQDISIISENPNMIVMGTQWGIKYYLHNVKKDIATQNIFQNTITPFSINDYINVINIKENWIYFNIWDELRSELGFILAHYPLFDRVEGISVSYINNQLKEKEHNFVFTLFTQDEISAAQLRILLSGLIETTAILGIASPTFVSILNNILFQEENEMLHMDIGFSTDDINKINLELTNLFDFSILNMENYPILDSDENIREKFEIDIDELNMIEEIIRESAEE